MASSKPAQAAVFVGLRMNHVDDIKNCLDQIIRKGEYSLSDYTDRYDFVCMNIMSDATVQEFFNESMKITKPFYWSDQTLSSSVWSKRVFGIISNLESEFEGSNTALKKRAGKILHQQLGICQHLSLHAAIIELKRKDSVNLASYLNNNIRSRNFDLRYWIKVPMASTMSETKDDSANPNEITDPWKTWNEFRTMCTYSEVLLNVVLELSEVNPSPEELKRWLGEPVKAIFIKKGFFTTNNGKPSMSTEHQNIIREFLQHKVKIVIDTGDWSEDLNLYPQYLEDILKSQEQNLRLLYVDPVSPDEELEGIPILRIPRSPVPLTSSNVVGNDVKNYVYKQAIKQAFMEKVPEEARKSKKLAVMVLGAGKGPLVELSLDAAQLAKVEIQVYAVEEITTGDIPFRLHHNDHDDKESIWKDNNVVVCKNIGSFIKLKLGKVDILIAEQFGYFGDNELTLQYLQSDGPRQILEDDGIIIPQSYTSFIAPIMSARTHHTIGRKTGPNSLKFYNYEKPFLINLEDKFHIAEPEKLFTFEHTIIGAKGRDETKSRYGVCKFIAKLDSVLHGFNGYFEAVLYGNHKLSICPSSVEYNKYHPKEWKNCTPVFFPIKYPIQIKKDSDIEVQFWRKTSKRHIWYEWGVTAPYIQPIQNAHGESSKLSIL